MPRNLRPACAAFADCATFELMLRDAVRHIAWQARHEVPAVPAFDFHMSDARQKQLVSHRSATSCLISSSEQPTSASRAYKAGRAAALCSSEKAAVLY